MNDKNKPKPVDVIDVMGEAAVMLHCDTDRAAAHRCAAELQQAQLAVRDLIEAVKRVVAETGSSGVAIPSITSTDALCVALAKVQPPCAAS